MFRYITHSNLMWRIFYRILSVPQIIVRIWIMLCWIHYLIRYWLRPTTKLGEKMEVQTSKHVGGACFILSIHTCAHMILVKYVKVVPFEPQHHNIQHLEMNVYQNVFLHCSTLCALWSQPMSSPCASQKLTQVEIELDGWCLSKQIMLLLISNHVSLQGKIFFIHAFTLLSWPYKTWRRGSPYIHYDI